jgi:hypothetical protein
MQRSAPLANETEFQEWLLLVLEAERERLGEATAARESRMHTSLEVIKKNTTKETQHHEDER